MENPAVEVTTVTQTIVSASASELGTTINQRPISQEVVTSDAATLSDHLVSAGGTIAENTGVQALLDFAGLNPPETEHTTAGRVIGHGLSLGIALGEIAVGASLIAAGTGGNLFGVGLDLTGVGAAVGVPVHAVSTAAIATGAVIGTHGVFTAANTSVNIYNQAKGWKETTENAERMKQGKAPIGNDGHPVELHHNGQKPNGELVPMTRTEHRGQGNFSKNHPYRGRSRIDRSKFKKIREQFWKDKVRTK